MATYPSGAALTKDSSELAAVRDYEDEEGY